MSIHLIKMAAGIDSLEHLQQRQVMYAKDDPAHGPMTLRHWTRHRPKRAAEMVGQSSIYWIFKGAIRARQVILDLEAYEHTDEQGQVLKQCAIVLDARALIPTIPQPRRPHQGWRYFPTEDAPRDAVSSTGDGADDMPLELQAELAALGLL